MPAQRWVFKILKLGSPVERDPVVEKQDVTRLLPKCVVHLRLGGDRLETVQCLALERLDRLGKSLFA